MEEVQRIKAGPATNSCRYYWINLAGVSLGTLCLITAYSILFYLQSSLHTKAGLGTMALAVEYVAQGVTCVFLPPYLMRTIGCKWTLVLSGVCISVFILANLKATFATLIPACVLMGMGYSTMWATMNTVVSDLAIGYARLTGSSEATTLSKFFCIFFVFLNSSAIWANIISSSILSPQEMFGDANVSAPHAVCGAQYCDSNNANVTSHVHEVTPCQLKSLVTASLIAISLGIVLIVTLLSSYDQKRQQSTESTTDRLLATIRFFRNPNLLLLVVCTSNAGLMFSFLSADFTKAFVTCTLGIHNVGWVNTCGGTVATVGTLFPIFVARHIPRVALFLGAVVLNIVVFVLLLVWTPDPEKPAVFYVIAVIWGLTFVVWLSQLLALYGDVFIDNHQEAYSSQRILDSIGLAIGFAWSHYLCVSTKIYIILGVLLTGTVGYLLVERRVHTSRKHDANTSTI